MVFFRVCTLLHGAISGGIVASWWCWYMHFKAPAAIDPLACSCRRFHTMIYQNEGLELNAFYFRFAEFIDNGEFRVSVLLLQKTNCGCQN